MNSGSRDFYRRFYDHVDLASYDPAWDEGTFRLRISAALQTIGSLPRTVLDFGCGTGAACHVLAAAGHL